MTRASVIVATYNGSEFVEEAIFSALRQTESDLEVIVVDDGSTDDTLQRLRRISASDGRLKVLTQAHAGRPSVGRNLGLRHARGEYVCFLDQDDAYHPDKVRESVACLDAHPEADIVFHDIEWIDAGGRKLPGTHLVNQRFLERAKDYLVPVGEQRFACSRRLYHFMSLNYSAMSTTSVMLRRSFLNRNALRFAEDLCVADDAALWFDISRAGRVMLLNQILSYYRLHGANASLNQERMLSDVARLHQKNYSVAQEIFDRREVRAYRRKLARIHFDLGYHYFMAERMSDARSSYRKGLAWRVSGRTLLAYVKTFAPLGLVRRWRQR